MDNDILSRKDEIKKRMREASDEDLASFASYASGYLSDQPMFFECFEAFEKHQISREAAKHEAPNPL